MSTSIREQVTTSLSNLCVEDADGDGYGSIPVNALPDCIIFNMFDDGAPSSWSSVFIEVTEDNTSTTTYALNAAQIQNGVHSEEHCFSVGTVRGRDTIAG